MKFAKLVLKLPKFKVLFFCRMQHPRLNGGRLHLSQAVFVGVPSQRSVSSGPRPLPLMVLCLEQVWEPRTWREYGGIAFRLRSRQTFPAMVFAKSGWMVQVRIEKTTSPPTPTPPRSHPHPELSISTRRLRLSNKQQWKFSSEMKSAVRTC